jgi:SAM-dependent methyltransferase
VRTWVKWSVSSAESELPIDSTYEQHAATAGGYEADDAYASRATFFERHLFSYQRVYEPLLLEHLTPPMKILSVASGRCAPELRLLQHGLDVTCSDLDAPACADATRELFPEWRFETLDILAGPASRTYDAVVTLSLIYLFDQVAFRTFLDNIAASLRPRGLLLLDSAGSPDNALSYLIHDVVLPFEARILCRRARRSGTQAGLVRKAHGYRRTDHEIIGTASDAGFRLIEKRAAEPLVEFRRSHIFNRLVPAGSKRERLFEPLGKRVPYVRMFCFQKI